MVRPSSRLMRLSSSRIERVVSGIERRGGLVGQQHLRLARQRPGNPHALFLATADLRRIAVLLRREAHQFEQRQHVRFDLGALQAGQFERQRDVLVHRARRQQVEMLEDHADLAPRLAQLRGGQRGEIATVDDDVAFGRAREQVDGAHERTLARAAAADDAEHLARRNRQIDVVQRLDPAPRSGKTLGDIAYFDHEKTKRRDCQRAWMRSRQAAAVTFIRI